MLSGGNEPEFDKVETKNDPVKKMVQSKKKFFTIFYTDSLFSINRFFDRPKIPIILNSLNILGSLDNLNIIDNPLTNANKFLFINFYYTKFDKV